MSFVEHLYAHSWSKIYHRITNYETMPPTFVCDGTRRIHDHMKVKLLTELRGKERLCLRCQR